MAKTYVLTGKFTKVQVGGKVVTPNDPVELSDKEVEVVKALGAEVEERKKKSSIRAQEKKEGE